MADDFGKGRSGKRRTHDHDVGPAADARDRRDIADEIKVEFLVQRRVDCGRSRLLKNRIVNPNIVVFEPTTRRGTRQVSRRILQKRRQLSSSPQFSIRILYQRHVHRFNQIESNQVAEKRL